jgi:uncharacterized membrane protein YhaH (DUF805 family)
VFASFQSASTSFSMIFFIVLSQSFVMKEGKKNWLAINVLVSLQSAKKKWIVLKIFCRNLAGFFYPFLFTTITNGDNKFGRNKKASTFALPIKRVAIKRLKDL